MGDTEGPHPCRVFLDFNFHSANVQEYLQGVDDGAASLGGQKVRVERDALLNG